MPPLKTANVDDNPVVEISFTNAALLNAWSPLDLLDPTRVTYLTYGIGSGSPVGVDNEHANAIIDDTNDNSIIVSLRNQNAVFKFSRSTGQLKWILGPPALWGTNWQPYLLTPVGTPFDWNYGQHAPELTPEGTLLLYNDDNYRASPFDPPVPDQSNYSSAVEYNINETNMAGVRGLEFRLADESRPAFYTLSWGGRSGFPKPGMSWSLTAPSPMSMELIPAPYAPSATMVRIIEYTHDPGAAGGV